MLESASRQGGFAAIKWFARTKFSETAQPWRLALSFLHAKDVSLTCRGGSVIGQFFRGDWGRGVAGIGMRRRVDGVTLHVRCERK